MWTPEDGSRYLRNNLDVLRAYERSDRKIGPTLYAQRHWEAIGRYEGRKSGPELDPTAKQPGVVDEDYSPIAIAKRRKEEDADAARIEAKPVEERTEYERDWLKNYRLKRDPLRGLKIVAPSVIAARYRVENPYLAEAWSALSWAKWFDYGGPMNFVLANPTLKPGDDPLPRLTDDELKALQVKYTLEM